MTYIAVIKLLMEKTTCDCYHYQLNLPACIVVHDFGFILKVLEEKEIISFFFQNDYASVLKKETRLQSATAVLRMALRITENPYPIHFT